MGAVAVILLASAVSDPEAFRRYAKPGLDRIAGPDTEVLVLAAVGSNARSHNLLLDAVAGRDDLEALVIVSQNAEITDPALPAKVRAALADPAIGVAGPAGATGVRSIAWWEGDVRTAAPFGHRYEEHGGGELPAFAWAGAEPAAGEVDTVHGVLMALSPWVVQNVRFDEDLRFGHGFDVDFCRQVREAGRTVVVADLQAIEHRPLELVDDLDLWVEAHVQWAEKWAEQGVDEAIWRDRARRVEADREATRTMAYSKALELDARVLELEQALADITESPSWKLTEPLRRFNQWRARRAAANGSD
jgi:Glycosyltransferase like family